MNKKFLWRQIYGSSDDIFQNDLIDWFRNCDFFIFGPFKTSFTASRLEQIWKCLALQNIRKRSLFKIVQVCLSLFKFIQVCLSLFKFIQVCSSLFKFFQVFSSLSKFVQVCPSLFNFVSSFSVLIPLNFRIHRDDQRNDIFRLLCFQCAAWSVM